MKKQKQIFPLAIAILLTIIISGCNQDAAPSLFQDQPKGSTPVISAVSPSGSGLAGITEVTITGSNFSTVNDNNMVFFGTLKATVLQSSATSIVVKAPSLIQNNLDLKIAVAGVENFSNTVKYNLLEGVGIYYPFAKGIDDPMTVTVDKNENVYVYLKDQGIKKISTDGKISAYATKGAESFFFDMKVGPGSSIYGTRNLRAIFQAAEGGATTTYVTFPTGIAIVTLDFDLNKNIWAAGSGGSMYSVTPAKEVTAFPIDYTASSLRVYNGYLYVAGKNSTEEAIYKYQINSNLSLGAKQKYFDIGAKYGLGKIQVGAITFNADGDLILGTDAANAFILVTSAGTSSDFYTGLIGPFARSMCWGTAKNLFYVREYTDYHTLVRVDMQKLGAPYYGRL
jgi:hypothetical protein